KGKKSSSKRGTSERMGVSCCSNNCVHSRPMLTRTNYSILRIWRGPRTISTRTEYSVKVRKEPSTRACLRMEESLPLRSQRQSTREKLNSSLMRLPFSRRSTIGMWLSYLGVAWKQSRRFWCTNSYRMGLSSNIY
ncbi:hypothetical protein NL676_001427, partial [Syzygium grande]